jgi:hypothetical protein
MQIQSVYWRSTKVLTVDSPQVLIHDACFVCNSILNREVGGLQWIGEKQREKQIKIYIEKEIVSLQYQEAGPNSKVWYRNLQHMEWNYSLSSFQIPT